MVVDWRHQTCSTMEELVIPSAKNKHGFWEWLLLISLFMQCLTHQHIRLGGPLQRKGGVGVNPWLQDWMAMSNTEPSSCHLERVLEEPVKSKTKAPAQGKWVLSLREQYILWIRIFIFLGAVTWIGRIPGPETKFFICHPSREQVRNVLPPL